MPQSDAGGLIQLIIVGVIVVASILGKLLTKKEPEGGTGSGEGSSPGPTREAQPLSPDEALEQMFREMQGRRKAAPPAQPAAPPVARQMPEQSLDQYFERREQPAAQRPVPKTPARPYREPAPRAYQPMRKPAPPRVILRRPKAAFAKAEGPTIAAEQGAAMAQAKARVEAAAALAGPDVMKSAAARPAAARPLVSMAGGKPDRAEAARAMIYLELFGPPRAVRAYEGPPSAG
jgi:hypothetical protein